MLQIRDLHAGYGATPILFGVSLDVNEGEAVALLGKNGMGKTTLMKTAMGFIKPTRGAVLFEGSDLARLTPFDPADTPFGLQLRAVEMVARALRGQALFLDRSSMPGTPSSAIWCARQCLRSWPSTLPPSKPRSAW